MYNLIKWALMAGFFVCLGYFWGELKSEDVVIKEVKELSIEIMPKTTGVDIEREKAWAAKMWDGEDPYDRVEAIRAFMEIRDEDSVNRIHEGLKDDTPSVVIASISALGELRDERSVSDLLSTYQNNEDRMDGYEEAVRIAVIEALGKIRSEEGLGVLHSALESEEGSIVFKRHIVESIGKIGSGSSVSALKAYLAELEQLKPSGDWGAMVFIWQESVEHVKSVIASIEEGE